MKMLQKLALTRVIDQIKSATHQKTPTQNTKEREDNTDDMKRQGQHKRQAHTWTDTDETNKYINISACEMVKCYTHAR